ncbi:MAG: thymidine kinase [Candidatus Sericytochromatia bacterium]|uniref:Thymidine kinase n=1 Tax=Candidatus Tanganyikabacteria bacterium TaxID=2961651 RepID=A0A937X5B8_9BACT|nr:thymidine kinase [Candidatus Tanganyikabacteria bacterium]
MRGFYAQPFQSGWIEVVCGSMYCGKSEELIRRVRRAEIAHQQVQAFKPIIDTRYYKEDISSHTGLRYRAVRAEGALEICQMVGPDTQVVAIDEVQFFDVGILDAVAQLADSGRRVICAGLDMDFRGRPFAIMPRLLAMAELVEKLTAICMVCGGPATRSQRLIDGRPAKWDDPIVLIGASDSYEPRCRLHHEVPMPPDRQLTLPIAPLEAAAIGSPILTETRALGAPV